MQAAQAMGGKPARKCMWAAVGSPPTFSVGASQNSSLPSVSMVPYRNSRSEASGCLSGTASRTCTGGGGGGSADLGLGSEPWELGGLGWDGVSPYRGGHSGCGTNKVLHRGAPHGKPKHGRGEEGVEGSWRGTPKRGAGTTAFGMICNTVLELQPW
jgi:hypothetical protein